MEYQVKVIACSGKALQGLLSRLIDKSVSNDWHRSGSPREAHRLFTGAKHGAGFTAFAPYEILGQVLLYNCCLHAPLGYGADNGAYALYFNLLIPYKHNDFSPAQLPRAVYVLCRDNVAYAYRCIDTDEFIIDGVIVGIIPAHKGRV